MSGKHKCLDTLHERTDSKGLYDVLFMRSLLKLQVFMKSLNPNNAMNAMQATTDLLLDFRFLGPSCTLGMIGCSTAKKHKQIVCPFLCNH